MKKIVKLLKIIFVIIIVTIIAVVLIIGITVKNFDLNDFRTQIITYLSDSLSRDIELGYISYEFSSRGSLVLNIKDMLVSDDKSFSDTPLLRADLISCNIDLFKFLFDRKIIISKIEILSPKVNLIKNNKGLLNFDQFIERVVSRQDVKISEKKAGLQRSKIKKNEYIANKDNGMARSESEIEIHEGLLRSMVKDFTIQDGSLTFLDLSSGNKINIPITNIFLNINNLSFNSWLDVNLKCSLFSKKKNIETKAKARLNVSNSQLALDDISLRLDMSDFSMEKIALGIPSLKDIKIRDNLQGELNVNARNIIFGPKGLSALSSEVHLVDGQVQFEDIDLPVSNIDIDLFADESNLDFKGISMYFASGKIDLKGKIDDYFRERALSFDIGFDEISMDDLTKDIDMPYDIQGKIFGEMLLNGSLKEGIAVLESINGEGNVGMKGGKILDFNILKFIIENISSIPDIGERIENDLSEEYKKILEKKDSDIKEGTALFKIQNKELLIKNAKLDIDGILVLAQGKVDYDQNLSLTKADIYFPEELSKAMVSAIEEFTYLIDENKLHIPLKTYNGKIDGFRTYPDIGGLSKQILKEKGKDELKKVIFKALNLDKEEPEDSQPAQSEEQYISTPKQSDSSETMESDQESDPEKEMINNILDAIFK